jgi:hypothetical protein
MRKLLALTIIILCISACKKDNLPADEQPQDEPSPLDTSANYVSYSGNLGIANNCVIRIDADYFIVLNGSSGSLSLRKFSTNGDEIWREKITLPLEYWAWGIDKLGDNLFLTGRAIDDYFSPTTHKSLLVKTTMAGDTLWCKSYSGPNNLNLSGVQIRATADGNLIILNNVYSQGNIFDDIFLMKLNSNGDTLWTRTYPKTGTQSPKNIFEAQNGDFVITAYSNLDSVPKLMLMRVNAGGVELWTRIFEITEGSQTGICTIELPDGSLLTCGNRITNGYQYPLVIKTNNQGNSIWEHGYTFKGNASSIKQNTDGTFTFTGSAYNDTLFRNVILLTTINADGDELWHKEIVGPNTSYHYGGQELLKSGDDDNIIIGKMGNVDLTNPSNQVFINKCDKNGD